MTKFGMLRYGFFLFALVSAPVIAGSVLIKKRWGAYSASAAVIILFGIASLSYIYQIEPYWIQIDRVKIRDKALAKILRDVKVVQISDIHMGNGIGSRERDLIAKTNSIRPDLIFVTGDIVDGKDQIPHAVKLLGSFKTRLGIWAVPGNTDHLSFSGETLALLLEESGIKFLLNDAAEIPVHNNQKLWVAGVDDPNTPGKLSRALAKVPAGAPVILLSHKPDIFNQAAEKNVNLVLAGHTHGGQVGIPFLVQLSRYANRGFYVSGLYQKKNSKLYVNRGIGTKTFPVRFLCRPEITLFEVTG